MLNVLISTPATSIERWHKEFIKSDSNYIFWRCDEDYRKDNMDVIVGWGFDGVWASSHKNVRAVVSVGSGVDHITNIDAIPESVPIVRTISKILQNKMAEFVTLSVLLWHRRLMEMIEGKKAKLWSRYSTRLADDISIGFLGYGGMSKACISAIEPFGYKIKVWAQSKRNLSRIEYFYGDENLVEFASGLDVIVNLLPLTDRTRGILSMGIFDKLNEGACLINVGRGGHVNLSDVKSAISSGRLACAVLDVFEEEPISKNSEIWEIDNIIISCHSAAVISAEIGIAEIVPILNDLKNLRTSKICLYDRAKKY